MPSPSDGQNIAVTAEDVRTSLRVYPTVKNSILGTMLRSYCLTLEVFIHRRLGERYITWPRILIGFLCLYIVGHAGVEWNLKTYYWIDKPDFYNVFTGETGLQTFPLFKYPNFQRTDVKLFGLEIPIPVFTNTTFEGVSIFALVLSVYLALAEWRLLEIFVFNRLGVPMHNRSSGEPYAFWDSVYLISHKFNFQIDLVKQVCEPAICGLLGLFFLFAKRSDAFTSSIPKNICVLFSVWLLTGAVALFLKAWLENQLRRQYFLDRVSNEFDMEGSRLQQRFFDQNEPVDASAIVERVVKPNPRAK